MELTQLSCEEFLSQLASKAPAPGGGGAAALVGAAGAALGNMVGSLMKLVVNSGVLVSWAILRTGLLPLVGIFMGRIRYLLSLLQVVAVRLNAIPLR